MNFKIISGFLLANPVVLVKHVLIFKNSSSYSNYTEVNKVFRSPQYLFF